MPCDYHILQSPTKGQVLLVLWETVGRPQLVIEEGGEYFWEDISTNNKDIVTQRQAMHKADLNHNNAPKADRYLDIQEHL